MDLSDFKLPQYYQHDLLVHSYEVDLNQRLSITSIFNYLQEIAWEHAKRLKYGWDDLNEKGWFWALSRVEVEIHRLPQWTEKIRLLTWPRIADGLFALRDFEIYDAQGEKIIAATSSWLVVNIQNRRPVRVGEWYNEFDYSKREALGRMASKISDSGTNPVFSEKLEVRIGDIDMNQHVNNVRYIDWAYNTFSFGHYKQYTPKTVIVNFNAEALASDLISVDLFEMPEHSNIVNINRASDSRNLCKLQFKWNKEV